MSDRAIRDAINQIAGTHLADKVYSVEATVISVDEDARTCVCQAVSGRAQNKITDVKLMASVDDGFLIIPTVGSTVNIVISDFTEPYISLYSEVDKIIFRGGDLGGLVKVISLVDRLNKIENKLNGVIALFNSHKHVLGGPVPIVPITGTLTETVRGDIENTKITQG